MKRLLRIIAIGVLTAVPLLDGLVSAASASIFLSPGSASVSKGSTLSIAVRENSGSEPVNAVEIHLSYPTDKFDFVSNSPGSAFSVTAASSGGGGTVRYDAGSIGGKTGDQLVVTVKLKAKVDSGSATVNVDAASRVVSANSNADIAGAKTGGTYTFKPAPVAPPAAPKDTTPPTISAISVSEVSFTGATVNWTTSEPASSEVDFGLNKNYGLSAVDANLVTAHKMVLNSALLSPGHLYHFAIKSVDGGGNTASSSDATFTTKGATLIATVLDQHNKAVKGAKVSFGESSSVTNKSGQATLQNLPEGKQGGSVEFRGKKTPVNVEITPLDAAGTPQKATFKINVSSNFIWILLIPLLALLLLAAWWVGREEGEGINPITAAKTTVLGWLGKGPKKGGPGGPSNSPPAQQTPPTVITPSS